MSRKETKRAIMPSSSDGIDIAGIGTVSTPPERRGWIRRHSNGMRIAIDGAAITGLATAEGLVFARTGLSHAILDSMFTGQVGLAIDGFQRWIWGKERSGESTIVELPRGSQYAGIGEVSKPLNPSSRETRIARRIFDIGYIAGTAMPIIATAANIAAKNWSELFLTGVADAVLIANLGERKTVFAHINDDDDGSEPQEGTYKNRKESNERGKYCI